ncbi:hypothetical protein HanHA89_Chr08g0278681 [Helianthus annuus]|nr:hypothetical protein HanHA89_Chr08g0278681 [Helianthus annuus]
MIKNSLLRLVYRQTLCFFFSGQGMHDQRLLMKPASAKRVCQMPPSIHSQLIVEQLIQPQYLPSVVQLTDSNIREEEQNLSHM